VGADVLREWLADDAEFIAARNRASQVQNRHLAR
jgi:hypothetical protein